MQEILSWENIPKSCEDEVPLGFVDSPITSKSNSKNVFPKVPPARATFRKMLHSSSLVSMGCVTTVAFVPVQRTTFRLKSHLGAIFCVGNPPENTWPPSFEFQNEKLNVVRCLPKETCWSSEFLACQPKNSIAQSH